MSGRDDSTQARLTTALRALTAYYDDHAETGEGTMPCPCRGCELAREVFAAELKEARRDGR